MVSDLLNPPYEWESFCVFIRSAVHLSSNSPLMLNYVIFFRTVSYRPLKIAANSLESAEKGKTDVRDVNVEHPCQE